MAEWNKHRVDLLRDEEASLWRSQVSKRELRTAEVGELCDDLVGQQRKFGEGAAYIKLPVPLPFGYPAALCLYLDLFIYLRSPSCPQGVRGRWRAPEFSEKTIRRVRRHLLGLAEEQRHEGARGQEWRAYLLLAVRLIERPVFDFAAEARPKNERRYESW